MADTRDVYRRRRLAALGALAAVAALAGAAVGAGVVEALPADAPRRLRGSVAPAVRSELQPTGEFALPNLERGRYDVLLRIGAREIELSDVEL
jgi:hypothetical protein